MKSSTMLWVVVALVVIAGGAYYFLGGSGSGGGAAVESAGDQASTTDQTSQSGVFNGSVADLVARGGDWKCTIDTSVDTGAGQVVSSGTVYVSGNKVYADFTADGYDTHMISDGAYTYTWSSAYPQGFKVAVEPGSTQSAPAATSGQGADANANYAYNCAPAATDASMFAPPSNVTFTSL